VVEELGEFCRLNSHLDGLPDEESLVRSHLLLQSFEEVVQPNKRGSATSKDLPLHGRKLFLRAVAIHTDQRSHEVLVDGYHQIGKFASDGGINVQREGLG